MDQTVVHKQRWRLERFMKRVRPGNVDNILTAADRLIPLLSAHGLVLTDKASNELPLVGHELRFERRLSDKHFAFVIVTFADDGELGFGASFGIRDYEPPFFKWHCSANLARRRIGIRKSCNLGAEWFTPFKKYRFWKDWHFLEANVDAIATFLETGRANRHMVDVFRPK